MEPSAVTSGHAVPQGLVDSARTLETQAVFREWPELCVVEVRGEDRVSWLNGQITNDVRQIPAGGCVHALAVNVRGKVLAELWVADAGEALLVLMPKRSAAALLESLERYIIMEDVTLTRADQLAVLSVEGPLAEMHASGIDAGEAVQLSWAPLGLGGHAWIGSEGALSHVRAQLSAHLTRVVPEAYELVQLRRGVPRFGVDFDEHNYPQEAGLKTLVSFQKGCYLGQEVVCTLENRGKLSKQLWVLQGATETPPATSTPLHDAEAASANDSLGTVTSAVWDPERKQTLVLAYVRRVHAAAGALVRAGTEPFTLVRAVGEDQAATPASP